MIKPGFPWNQIAASLAIFFVGLAWGLRSAAETSSAASRATHSAIAATEDSNFGCLGPQTAVSRNTTPVQRFAEHSAGEAPSLTVSRIKRTLTLDSVSVSVGLCPLPGGNGVNLFSGPPRRQATIESGTLVARKIRLQV